MLYEQIKDELMLSGISFFRVFYLECSNKTEIMLYTLSRRSDVKFVWDENKTISNKNKLGTTRIYKKSCSKFIR